MSPPLTAIAPRRQKRCGSPAVRAAYTLLEVLLALSLATALLAAVLAGLSSYAQFVRSGQRSVELASLGRALLLDIEKDLRSLVRPGELPASPWNSGNLPGSSPLADRVPSRVLLGDSDGLMLRVQRTHDSSVPEAGAAPATRLISHYLVRENRVASMALEKAGARLPRTIGNRPAVGWLRAIARVPPGEGADLPRALEDVPWICGGDVEQVVGLKFRYFDGQQWHAEWDNVARRALPQMVEVVVSIVENPANGRSMSAPTIAGGAASVEIPLSAVPTYRLVVNLRVAEESHGH